MTIAKELLPLINPNGNLVDEKSGEVKLKYLAGYPRQIRFDASKGFFNVKGITPLTKKGGSFTIQPIAYRIFKDNILGMGVKSWAEFFFINNSNQICALLIHGYSVQNLMQQADEMFYDDVNFNQVSLTITPIEKTSKTQDEKGNFNKYYICHFDYEKLDKKVLDTLTAAKAGLQIWREETLTGDAISLFTDNYNPPIVKEELSAAERKEVADAVTKELEVVGKELEKTNSKKATK